MDTDKVIARLSSIFGETIVGGGTPGGVLTIYTDRDLETDDLYELRDEVKALYPDTPYKVENVGALTPYN